MANETLTDLPVNQADPMGIIASMLLSPVAFVFYGIIIGVIVVVLFYIFVYKKSDKDVFEYEKFEDTVIHSLKKTFQTEGQNSKSKLVHGINNPIGSVDKWIKHSGEWKDLEYDAGTRNYIEKTKSVKEIKKDKNGKDILDKKGNPVYITKTEPVKIPYDLLIFRVKGQGFFDEPQFVICENEHVKYNSQANTWNILKEVSLNQYGGAWITGIKAEHFVNDISFRRSLENNMTFLQNQSRKVIFLETAFSQRHEMKIGSGIAKKLSYDQYAKKVLKDAGDLEDEDDT